MDIAQTPSDWHFHGFPLAGLDEEVMALDTVVHQAHSLIQRVQTTGDHAYLGPVLHWAHLLKIEQGPDGAWPASVNARTGATIGTARTTSPISVLARLGAILHSSEFEAALARAKRVRRGES